MMKSGILTPKTAAFLPFILITLGAVLLIEHQNTPSLPPPNMSINSHTVREPNERQFALSNLSGKTIRLSDFQGQAILLNFFATWCPPCREEMPSLEELYQTNKDQGLVVLGVAGDEDGKAVASLVKETGVTFPVVLDPQKVAFSQYFVRGIPITFLLDRQGRIAGMYPGEADWSSEKAQALIKQLLQEPYDQEFGS